MPSETFKMTQSSSDQEGEHHRKLDREIRQMVSAITHRVTDFHKTGSSTHQVDEDDVNGMRIITLAGNNNGATLKSEMDEKKAHHLHGISDGTDPEALSTYVNSNFQAINNSLMLGGSYTANDPGVHMEIEEVIHEQKGHKPEKHGKKEKKKEKETSKSEDHDHGHSN